MVITDTVICIPVGPFVDDLCLFVLGYDDNFLKRIFETSSAGQYCIIPDASYSPFSIPENCVRISQDFAAAPIHKNRVLVFPFW